MSRRLLILDDEPGVLAALQRTLRRCFPGADLQVETHTDPEQALLRCGEATFDVVMSDYHLPGFSGVDFLHMLKHIQPQAVRVVLSASTDFDVVMKAVNHAEVFRYLAKPWSDDELRTVLELAFARAAQLRAPAPAAAATPALPPTPQELEAQRLEREEPGITRVNWRPDGAIDL
jgi:DNA-binding NtrC family response regulator